MSAVVQEGRGGPGVSRPNSARAVPHTETRSYLRRRSPRKLGRHLPMPSSNGNAVGGCALPRTGRSHREVAKSSQAFETALLRPEIHLLENNAPTAMPDTAGRARSSGRSICKLSPPPRSWRDRRRQALSTNQT
jgi:hypothetical protein